MDDTEIKRAILKMEEWLSSDEKKWGLAEFCFENNFLANDLLEATKKDSLLKRKMDQLKDHVAFHMKKSMREGALEKSYYQRHISVYDAELDSYEYEKLRRESAIRIEEHKKKMEAQVAALPSMNECIQIFNYSDCIKEWNEPKEEDV